MKATLKNYRQSPRKVRLIANLIRGKDVPNALTLLTFLRKKGALPLHKLVQSAVSNAKAHGKNPDTLKIEKINVDEGLTFKRLEYRARGAANIIKKRTSHITLTLEEKEKAQSVQTEEKK